ncbi:MAG TPA: DUF1616 domain-containing protein [Candidatus Dormibacteraeota bacterium]|jgi:uncharacterized membrane protein|nr:DUF1616 domain-containing protein [Candidatus Dormibacteraeota bacterium]
MRVAEWNRWTALAAGAVIAAGVGLTGIGGTVLGVLLGVPLVLVLPGLALTGALWPRGRGVPERAALAIGLSLALAAVSALALNWLPGGVTPARSTVLLGMVTLVGACVAAARRPLEDPAARPRDPWRPPIRAHQAAMLVLALALVGAAVTLAVRGAEQATGPGFTQAWMLPRPNAVAVGLGNDQGAAQAYRVVLNDDGQTLQTWGDVRLAAGAHWSATASVPAGAGSEVTLRVYRRSDPERVYRQLHVTVTREGK